MKRPRLYYAPLCTSSDFHAGGYAMKSALYRNQNGKLRLVVATATPTSFIEGVFTWRLVWVRA